MTAALLAPVAALLVLAAVAAGLGVQRWWQRRLVGTVLTAAAAHSDGELPDILYFTGPNCTVCHVAQRPALRRLREVVADVAIREVDVAREPATARRYRVMTLPTTVVLDRAGRTTAVNVGYASEVVLRRQVDAARGAALATALA